MFMFDFLCIWMSCFFGYIVFFFFKQKTAYELRISDWSSDVCSSDLSFLLWGNIAFAMLCLYAPVFVQYRIARRKAVLLGWEVDCAERTAFADYAILHAIWPPAWRGTVGILASGRASCQERVWQYG